MTGLESRRVFECLLQREKLGSTGLGQGIAIPHGKFSELDRVQGLFARLAHPVDFDAPDDQPVDLVFLLLAPESAGADHLKALARISRLLRDPALVESSGAPTAPRGSTQSSQSPQHRPRTPREAQTETAASQISSMHAHGHEIMLESVSHGGLPAA
jgi:hypothetical protein